MTIVSHVRSEGRLIKIKDNIKRKRLLRGNQASNFLGDSFSNKGKLSYPIQFKPKRQSQYLIR